MVRKDNGTVQIAGSPRRTAGHPVLPMPTIVRITAMEEVLPPRASPPSAPTHDVVGKGAGHADQETRGGREKRGKCPSGHQRAEHCAEYPGRCQSGQDEDDRVGLARDIEAGSFQPPEYGEDGGKT